MMIGSATDSDSAAVADRTPDMNEAVVASLMPFLPSSLSHPAATTSTPPATTTTSASPLKNHALYSAAAQNENHHHHHSSNPYTSISVSPCRNYAIAACKDQLQLIGIQTTQQQPQQQSGLRLLKSIAMTPYWISQPKSQHPKTNNTPPNPNPNSTQNTTTAAAAAAEINYYFKDPFGFSRRRGNLNNNKNRGNSNSKNIDPAFIHPTPPSAVVTTTSETIFVLSDVSWSPEYYDDTDDDSDNDDLDVDFNDDDPNYDDNNDDDEEEEEEDATTKTIKTSQSSYSLIAAAGSNGVVVVWNASHWLDPDPDPTMPPSSFTTSSSASYYPPEAVLCDDHNHHHHHPGPPRRLGAALVNRLAWHPHKPRLLTASQDARVVLYERQPPPKDEGGVRQPPRRTNRPLSSTSTTATTTTTTALTTTETMTNPFVALGLNRWLGQHFLQPSPPPTPPQQRTTSPRRSTIIGSAANSSSTTTRNNHSGNNNSSSRSSSNRRASEGSRRSRRNSSNSRSRSSSSRRWSRSDNDYLWSLKRRYEPKSEAVRDIQWSPFFEDVFALVTSSGALIAYNRHVPPRALVKLTAHAGDAITLSWHPRRPYIIASGGARDKSVKVWNLEPFLNLDNHNNSISHHNHNDDVSTQHPTTTTTLTSTSSSTLSGIDSSPNLWSQSWGSTASLSRHHSTGSVGKMNSGVSGSSSATTPKALVCVLAVSASVTRLHWRPPSRMYVVTSVSSSSPDMDKKDSPPASLSEDLHDAMMAVASAPIKGTSAGGAGLLSLWSMYRPYMPLSVVEGHKDGAVTDFEWLESPPPIPPYIVDNPDDPVIEDDDPLRPRIWQHILSVGRDGRCLVQSLVRGEKPIAQVPPSCFAMANVSPFQTGCGSLQLFSVSQKTPLDPVHEFYLTGLRRDALTAVAPGMFREEPLDHEKQRISVVSSAKNRRLGVLPTFPDSMPKLLCTIVDEGALCNNDACSVPIQSADAQRSMTMPIAPEVLHVSRFASQYILYPTTSTTATNAVPRSRADICLHNAGVAERLLYHGLANMWRMLASMVEGSSFLHDDIGGLSPDHCLPTGTATTGIGGSDNSNNMNVISFVILPVLRDLLLERAEAGDVQTCVVICEVFQIIRVTAPPNHGQGVVSLRVPDLEICLVREWYMSYLDLLWNMCLYAHATDLIRHCHDPFIAALNQQSTTLHESCPSCGKPLLPDGSGIGGGVISTEEEEDTTNTATATMVVGGNPRRVCKSCRSRVGLCFLCHEPVNGIYVWCPGCGHGGHLDCALLWFGGGTGGAGSSTGSCSSPCAPVVMREMCPTGCGHKCNLLPHNGTVRSTLTTTLSDTRNHSNNCVLVTD